MAHHFKALGLPVGSTVEEVRSAFRKVARRWHPDKCQAPEAGERFRRAHEAFEVLVEKRTAACGLGKVGSTCADADDSDSWEPPPPPKRKPAPVPEVPEAEPAEQLPILGLAALLELVKCCSGDMSIELKPRFLQASLTWPWGCPQNELRPKLAEILRDELDKRVNAGEWARLEKSDLVWWLDARGCCLKYALEDESVDKQVFVGLVSKQRATGPSVTSLPCLASVASEPCKALCVSSSQEQPNSRKLQPGQDSTALASLEDCLHALQHSLQKGRGEEGAKYLLRLALKGKEFRGKKMQVKVLVAAIKKLGIELAAKALTL
eukprot:TRINITY_DN50028_c0_g1_i1.p1 TRINITY_DN50028_c0_g1~~TRINITY_DN50028_c0_g1_i1.p1  ORF type:complete len:321 (-),score=65.44 TRINITY_DN50028_c0_g1_i1:260-1222(-)